MSIRSVSCKLVLLALIMGVTILPCVPTQAAGLPGPDLEGSVSWFAPILEWLGWNVTGDEALPERVLSPVTDDFTASPTPDLDTSTTSSDEEDDRNASLDPNG